MITSTNGPIIIDICVCVCVALGKMKFFTRLRICDENFAAAVAAAMKTRWFTVIIH